MMKDVLLLTPPFTQMNTPYPATGYLKGFFNTQGITSFQADLGLDVVLSIFSDKGLTEMFNQTTGLDQYSYNAQRIYALKSVYIAEIDNVIQFLQGKKPSMAYRIVEGKCLPEASRFENLEELSYAFGNMGTVNLAKHLATLFLEDLSDFIVEVIDEDFGFSRYAERIGRSANSFDEIYNRLQKPYTWIDELTIQQLEKYMNEHKPKWVGCSVPFPGNLFLGFRCAQWIKENYQEVSICLGGGFPNTELRSVEDPRVFEFFDYITLDDGEAPLFQLNRYLKGEIELSNLKRTFCLVDNKVTYINNSSVTDFKQSEVGTPDYRDLRWQDYLSVIEVTNPMHRLWSDGKWNKLTMAHGCYWKKCTFCDISLDYIAIYEPIAAKLIVDRMEALLEQNGIDGFHFVDEAAPPVLMKSVALEILQRNLQVVWWTNIRFEKSFTYDLCVLLKKSGCIAVSGGLEVASERILKMINKGVTLKQVSRVTDNFTRAGIMTHAYLMYGFPTQTDQETIDSLEVVRQLFEVGTIQSGFWHQFAMTAHAPIGMDPKVFGVSAKSAKEKGFANNDIEHEDPSGADHQKYSQGLKVSLFNYMNGVGLDWPLHKWFKFKTPKTSINKNFVQENLSESVSMDIVDNLRLIYLGANIDVTNGHIVFRNHQLEFEVALPTKESLLIKTLFNMSLNQKVTLEHFKSEWNKISETPFLLLWTQDWFLQLREEGLVVFI